MPPGHGALVATSAQPTIAASGAVRQTCRRSGEAGSSARFFFSAVTSAALSARQSGASSRPASLSGASTHASRQRCAALLDDRQQRGEPIAARHRLRAAEHVQELPREDQLAPRRILGGDRAAVAHELDEPAAALCAHESARIAHELLRALALEARAAIREETRRSDGVKIPFRSRSLLFHPAVL